MYGLTGKRKGMIFFKAKKCFRYYFKTLDIAGLL